MTRFSAMAEHNPQRFTKSFTQQEPIPQAAIDAAVRVMRSGRLHRYNVTDDAETSCTAELETNFARYQQVDYCIACASGGYAMQLALRAAGVEHGDVVLSNAFTLSPVPGAIVAVGGAPALIETTEELVIDLNHLESVARASNARFLLLSHMRGHIADMHAVVALCNTLKLTLIEDCAHTMGANFDGARSGTHGTLACFSTQTYKHLNSGEGGLVTTNDATIASRLVLMSGSYMLFARHRAAPSPSTIARDQLAMPNLSGRMDELRASILLAQLSALDENVSRWNERAALISDALQDIRGLTMPETHPLAQEVRSSLQFRVPTLNADGIRNFLTRCTARGIELKWFGSDNPQGYTSHYSHWAYLESSQLPRTDELLATLLDVRIPLSFTLDDCRTLGLMLRKELLTVT